MAYQPANTIHDFPSFKAVTAEPHQVARLYLYAMLDPLVDLAYKVSCDFFRRPDIYTKLEANLPGEAGSKSISAILAKLHARSGTNEFFPSADQRSEIYLPIFGQAPSATTSESGDFPRLRDELIDATTAFAERAVDTGLAMLRERIRATARPLTDYFSGLQGDSLKWSAEQALPSLTEDVCYTILRNSGVAGVFGITTAPKANWPYTEDANADKLVEAISSQLVSATDSGAATGNVRPRFSTVQRAAVRGAEAIATIADFDEEKNDDLDALITQVYTWGSALSGLRSGAKGTQPSPSEKPGVVQPAGKWSRARKI
jgi:hypothetical protein